MGQKKQDKPIFKRWWFWVIVAFAVVVIIGAIGDSVEKDSQEAVKPVAKKESKQKQIDDSNKGKDIYLSEVKPWYDSILSEYDSSWEELWQGTWTEVSESKLTLEQANGRFVDLRDNKLFPLMDKIEEYNAPETFTKEQKAAIEKFKEKMSLSVDVRINAVTEAILVTEGGMELDTDIILETIDRGNKYMLEAVEEMSSLKAQLNKK